MPKMNNPMQIKSDFIRREVYHYGIHLAVVSLFLIGISIAQTTVVVSGQVLDPTGKIYQNGNGRAVLVPQNVNWLVNSTNPVPTPIIISGLDAFGRFSIAVTRTDLISPQTLLPKWQFSFCSQSIDFSPVCFTMTPLVITTAQDITTQIQSQSSLLPATGAGGNLSTQGTFTPGHMVSIFDTTHLQDLGVTGGGIGALGVLNISPNFTGTVTMAGLKFPSQTGTTSCMYIDTTGLVNFTGTACGAGGGGGVFGTNKQLFLNNAGSGAGTAVLAGGNIVSQMTYDVVSGKTSIPNLSGIRYTESYNWSQLPATDLTSAGSKTITLNPCPLGIDASNNPAFPYSVYISTTGTPEVSLVTGGTCTSGAATGTITLTTVNTHANGYTVSSTTGGINEALNDAGTPMAYVKVSPSKGQGTGNSISVLSPIIIQSNHVVLDGGGASLNCSTRNRCIQIGKLGDANFFGGVTVKDFRMASSLTNSSVAITNTSCAAGIATITTGSAHNFVSGDSVDIQYTGHTEYWGGTVGSTAGITVTDSTHFTFAANGCPSAAADSGWAALQNSAIEDSVNGSNIERIFFSTPGGITGKFQNGIVVDNDQSARITELNANSPFYCSSGGYCGATIYAPGPFGVNASVIYVDKANINLQCQGNGINNLAGNTLSVTDSVIQGFSQFAVDSGNVKGGFGPTTLTNVYEEVGSCQNFNYPGSGLQQRAMAGTIQRGTFSTTRGGEAPIGQIPRFAATGNSGTQYNYYVVIRDSTKGVSGQLIFGYASVDSATPTGSITLAWPRVQGTGTVTYDILRTAGTAAPYNGGCTGGSTNACGSIATSVAQCTTFVCTTTDTASASTTSYAVPIQTFYPKLNFWPGGLVITPINDQLTDSPGPLAFVESLAFITNQSPMVSAVGIWTPSVISGRCDSSTPGIWVSCLTGNSSGASNSGVGSVLLQNGPANSGSITANLKGRINILNNPNIGINVGHLITLVDSAPQKTLNSPAYRPTNDVNDTFIGLDNGNVNTNQARLSLGAPLSISQYIANVGDGTSWLERLTATDKFINVKTTVNDGTGATQFRGTFGTCNNPGDVNHSTVCYDPSGDLAYNKKNTTNFRKVIPQDYTVATLPVTSLDSGQLAVVTDALSSGCPLTGGGTVRILVRWNGSIWDCVSGGGGTTITTSTFASLPGSPTTGTLAIVNDWTGTCPVTTGSGSPGNYLLVRWSGSVWNCVTPTNAIPFNFTAQPWDGTQALGSTGGLHFGTPSAVLTNTNLDTNAVFFANTPGGNPASQIAFVDTLANSFYTASWASNLSLPTSPNKKCVDIDFQGHLQFFSGDCLADPTTTNGDMIIRSSGALNRLSAGTNGQVVTMVSGLPAWASGALTNPMTTKGDLIQSSDNSGTPARVPAGATGQVLTMQGSGLWGAQNASIGGTVNSGALGQLSYYQAAGTAVSGLANTVGSDGVAAPVLAITTTSATKENLLLNCITPGSSNCFSVQIGGLNKLFVEPSGAIDLSGGATKVSNNYVYQSQTAAQSVDYSQGVDSNATQGIGTYRSGNVTGTGNFTAGTARFQPGALTNASPGASSVEGKIIFNGAVLKKGATVTNGNVGCIEADNTVRDCSSTANNHKFVGVIESTVGGSTYVQTAGSVVVNLDASSTFNSNDFVCISTTGAAQGHMNGTTACPGYNDHIGFAIAGGTSVSTVNVVLVR